MGKIMTMVAMLIAAMMAIATGAAAQVPPDECYGDDVLNPEPTCVSPTEVTQPTEAPTTQPTEDGEVAPIDTGNPPERGQAAPVSRDAARPAAQLAQTGMTLSVGLVTGVGLLVAGLGLLLVSRRRKSVLQ